MAKRLYNSALLVNKDDFQVISPENTTLIRKNQKNEMIYYMDHKFKMIDRQTIISLQTLDKDVKSAFCCTHASKGCRCKFILMNNGDGKIINEHKPDLLHILDIQNKRRYDLKTFISSQITNNPSISPQQLITEYIRNINYHIDCFTPDKRYISQLISYSKRNIVGKVPKQLGEAEFIQLKEKYPNIVRDRLVYEEVSGEKKQCFFIYSDYGGSECVF